MVNSKRKLVMEDTKTVANVFKYEVANIQTSKALFKQVGNPPLKEKQYWYDQSGDLFLIVTLPENPSEFTAIQVLEFRRAILMDFPFRDFKRWIYAPLILIKI